MKNIFKNFPAVGFFVSVLGLFLLFSPLFTPNHSAEVWATDFDSVIYPWILESVFRSVWIFHDLVNFNANIFYPHLHSLAYTDSMLSAQIIYGPLRFLGINTLNSTYLTLAIITLIGCMLTDYSLKRVGKFSALERGFIIFASHFSLTITSNFSHYQLFGFNFLPSLILLIFLVLRDFQARDILMVFVLFFIATTFAIYIAPMLGMVLLLLFPIIYSKFLKKNNFYLKKSYNLILFFILSIFFGTVLYYLYFRYYIIVAKDFPLQSFQETATYSAKIDSILHDYSYFSFFYTPYRGDIGSWERGLFPGFLLLFFSSTAFLFLILKFTIKNYLLKLARHDLEFFYFAIFLFLAAFILSLGPYSFHGIKLPFYYFSELFSWLRSIRAPGRFGFFMGLPLGILSVFGIRILLIKTNLKTYFTLIFCFIFTAFIIESIPSFKTFPIPYNDKGPYFNVAPFIKNNSVVIDLPICGSDHFDTLKRVMSQMNNSFIYSGKLVVGYSSKTSVESSELINLDCSFQQHQSKFDDFLSFASRLKVNYLIIRKSSYTKAIQIQIEKDLMLLDQDRIVYSTNDLILLKVK